jgi:tape measure domain-containing protein
MFELLSTFITVRAQGLEEVFKQLRELEKISKRLGKQKITVAATGAAALSSAVQKARQESSSTTRVGRSRQPTEVRADTLEARRERIAARTEEQILARRILARRLFAARRKKVSDQIAREELATLRRQAREVQRAERERQRALLQSTSLEGRRARLAQRAEIEQVRRDARARSLRRRREREQQRELRRTGTSIEARLARVTARTELEQLKRNAKARSLIRAREQRALREAAKERQRIAREDTSPEARLLRVTNRTQVQQAARDRRARAVRRQRDAQREREISRGQARDQRQRLNQQREEVLRAKGAVDERLRLTLIQRRVQAQLEQQNITSEQRLRILRLQLQVTTRLATIEGARARQAQTTLTSIRQLGFDLGAASGRIGNYAAALGRVGLSAVRVFQNLGLVGSAASLAGVGIGSLVVGGLVGLQALVAATRALGQALLFVARTAFRAFTRAVTFALGPTIALARGIRNLVANLPLIAAAVGGLATRALFQTAQRLEDIRLRFSFAFGADSQAELQRIQALALQLAVPLDEIENLYGKISAAAKNSGVPQDEIFQLFRGTAAAARVLNVETSDLNRVFRAYEQVISKGVLRSEELNNQLTEGLPGAIGLVERAIGKSGEALTEALRNNEISAREFIKAVGDQAFSEFFEQAVLQAESLSGVVTTLGNQFTLLRRQVAANFLGVFRTIGLEIGKAIGFLRENPAFARFVESVATSVTLVIDRIKEFVQSGRAAEFFAPIVAAGQRLVSILSVINGVAIIRLTEGFRRLSAVALPALEELETRLKRAFRIENFDSLIEGITFLADNFELVFNIAVYRAKAFGYELVGVAINFAKALADNTFRVIARITDAIRNPFRAPEIAAQLLGGFEDQLLTFFGDAVSNELQLRIAEGELDRRADAYRKELAEREKIIKAEEEARLKAQQEREQQRSQQQGAPAPEPDINSVAQQVRSQIFGIIDFRNQLQQSVTTETKMLQQQERTANGIAAIQRELSALAQGIEFARRAPDQLGGLV